MNDTTVPAPDLTPDYPSRGKRLGPAWAEAWERFSRDPTAWHDGVPLWEEIAPKHGLSPETLRALLYRMAVGGILERTSIQVQSESGEGLRSHTHFRIASR